MMRRSVRALVLLVTIAVTAGVVWRATVNEQARGRTRLASQQTDAAAADAVFELWDLRSSLHAYVAPGQSDVFWSSRARLQMESVRTRLRELEPAAAAANHPLTAALTSLDALAAGERRALAAVREGQPLIAGDVIFTELRDLVDAAARDVSDARQAMARASSASETVAANEQSLLAGALIGTWIFALILLVPVPSAPKPAAVAEPAATSEPLGLHLRDFAPTPKDPPASVAPDATAAEASPALSAASVASAASAPSAALLQSFADLCTAIGGVADAGDLDPMLARVAELLGADGLVVWLVSDDGGKLVAAMAHGYDPKILGRLGPIAIDDHNLTAAAFRTGAPMQAPADGGTPGAVAVPLLSASGVSGVLAAEVPDGTPLDRTVALAAIVAAQLASLFPAPQVTAADTAVRSAGA